MMRDHHGSKNPNAILTPLLVKEVRRLHRLGFGYGWIASWLSVSKSCIQGILTGRTWKASKKRTRRDKVRS